MSKRNRTGLLLLAGVLTFGTAAALASCGEKPKDPDTPAESEKDKIETITITNADALKTLTVGDKKDITVAVTPTSIAADDARITVTSSDTTVVKVTGRSLEALKAGTATITVAGDGKKAEVAITVKAPEVVYNSITIKNKEALMAEWHVGDEDRTLDLATDPAGNITTLINSGKITITSSDPAVITVIGKKLAVKKDGTATITVKIGDKEDSVEITTLAKVEIPTEKINDLVVNTFEEIKAADKHITADKHTVKAVIVATDNTENAVIYDGESFMNTYSFSNEKDVKVGDTVIAEGQVAHYWGSFQLKNGSYTLSEDKIALPTAESIDANALKDLKAISTSWDLNKSTVDKRYPTKYATLAGEYIGDNNMMVGDYKISIYKANPAMKAEIAKLGVGDLIKINAGLIGYNSKNGYFNALPTSVEVTKKAINPTKVNFTLPTTGKTFDRVDLSDFVTFEPADASAKMTYKITDENKITTTKRNELMPIAEGTYTVTAIANEGVKDLEVKSEPVTVTVSGAGDNIFTKAQTKTIAEFNAIQGEDKTNLYKVTGTLTAVDTTSKYRDNGKITLTDGKDTLKPWSISGSLLDFYTKADGTIGFNNSKNFLPEIFNSKIAAVGDKVEILIKHGQYDGKDSFDSVFLRTVEKATPVEPETPAVKGTQLTTTNLGIGGSYGNGEATVNGTKFAFVECGNYGHGIQMRTKKDKTTEEILAVSTISNTTAIEKGVTEIKFKYNTAKADKEIIEALKVEAGDAADALTEAKLLTIQANVTEYTITFSKACKFVKLTHNGKNSLYFDSITLVHE